MVLDLDTSIVCDIPNKKFRRSKRMTVDEMSLADDQQSPYLQTGKRKPRRAKRLTVEVKSTPKINDSVNMSALINSSVIISQSNGKLNNSLYSRRSRLN